MIKSSAYFAALATATFLCAAPVGSEDRLVVHPSCPPLANLGPEQVGAFADMIFTLQRLGGRSILLAEGTITAATPTRLRDAIAQVGRIDEIWIRSGGGNAFAGNEAAQVIRAAGLTVRVPREWWCISACNFLFFGGVGRIIDPGGQFAIHMATAVNNENFQDRVLALQAAVISTAQEEGVNSAQLAVEATQEMLAIIGAREQSMAVLSADDVDVLLRMGVSRRLLDAMYEQRADSFIDNDGDGLLDIGRLPTFRCLTREELVTYNVVNRN